MRSAGFVRHPNEWWHFSHGDQLWAWSVKAEQALYASVPQQLMHRLVTQAVDVSTKTATNSALFPVDQQGLQG